MFSFTPSGREITSLSCPILNTSIAVNLFVKRGYESMHTRYQNVAPHKFTLHCYSRRVYFNGVHELPLVGSPLFDGVPELRRREPPYTRPV